MNAAAKIHLDTQFNAGMVDRRIFSGFLEHLGRAIYEGVYDPGNSLSDERGFRRDVLDALGSLRMPLVRYPGGNFVSCYDWRDGVGPRDKRPSRPDLAWKSTESNAFGTDEFMQWCALLNSAPMMAVNLGTGTAQSAAALLEYCNLPRGTQWADLRAANGRAEPYGVKTWCLGNEMDGPWQAGHCPAEEYASRADQAGKLMKSLDPSIELVVCGSSGRGMPTYMEWDRRVLEYCWEGVDYISAHRYSSNNRGDSGWYLAEGLEIERVISDYRALLNYIRALKKTDKRVYLSFDEWNAWYREMNGDGGWKQAPHLLEEKYNLEDALVCAQYLNSFIRNADLVKIACLAQIVNVIAPVLTRNDGVLLQSIYYPFMFYAQHASGLSLTPSISSPTYKAGERGDVPVLDASATFDPRTGAAAIFLVNRDQKNGLNVDLELADATFEKLTGADAFTSSDLKACNTWEAPQTLRVSHAEAASLFPSAARVKLPPQSMTVLRAIVRRK
jgi:alpha-L-arabinofuranosidase